MVSPSKRHAHHRRCNKSVTKIEKQLRRSLVVHAERLSPCVVTQGVVHINELKNVTDIITDDGNKKENNGNLITKCSRGASRKRKSSQRIPLKVGKTPKVDKTASHQAKDSHESEKPGHHVKYPAVVVGRPSVCVVSVKRIDEPAHRRSDVKSVVAKKYVDKIHALQDMLTTTVNTHRQLLCAKDEELQRLRNQLTWKDEQVEDMNEMISVNTQLKSRINAILSDKTVYEKEMKAIHEEETKRRTTRSTTKRDDQSDDQPDDHPDDQPDELDSESDEDVMIIEDPDTLSSKDGDKQPSIKVDSSQTTDEKVNDNASTPKGRKSIHKVLTGSELQARTKMAEKAEKERKLRVAEEHEKHIVQTEVDARSQIVITRKLVLSTSEPVVQVNSKLIQKLKPHQVEAVRFMWDNLIESADKLHARDAGNGCILAHCMGLGKTLSVIAFLHTLLSSKVINSCLVIAPLNAVLNWMHEWHKWIDKKDLPNVYELASCRNNRERISKLTSWHKEGGVMIMGYQIFRIMAAYKGRSRKNRQIFEETLLNPGSDVVVCDEGHMLKNDASSLSRYVNHVKTKKRIVLTGTPLQNNLNEYHCMMNFVKPHLLGTRREFFNRFVNPITNGQYSDSTTRDERLMKRRAHVLHEMLHACVQRRDYSTLSSLLPEKREFVLSVRLSPIQIQLYEKYLSEFVPADGAMNGTNLFSDYHNLMRIWTHPWMLKLDEIRQEKKITYDSSDDEEVLGVMSESEEEEEEEEDDDEFESCLSGDDGDAEVITQPKHIQLDLTNNDEDNEKEEDKTKDDILKSEVPEAGLRRQTRSGKVTSDVDIDKSTTVPDAWWSSLVSEVHKDALELSGKMVLLSEIAQRSHELGDKLLVFTQSILTLDLIEDFFAYKTEEEEEEEEKQKSDTKMTKTSSKWVYGEDYIRMDGSTSANLRTKYTNAFNDPSNKRLRIFLISTKAGGLGINLATANRVILFDASWNPSHDIQSIFRVYRFGQKKPVYVYRLLAQGTMEEKIYERQITKETLSQRVIDEHQLDRHFSASDLHELYRFNPDRLDDPNRQQTPTPAVPKDTVLAGLLLSMSPWITRFHEHDSLLVNHPEEDLNEEERKAAWEEYEKQAVYGHIAHAGMHGDVDLQDAGSVPSEVYTLKPGLSTNTSPTEVVTANGITSQQHQVSSNAYQTFRLKKIVQEILKYNPKIGANELKTRLETFLSSRTAKIRPSSIVTSSKPGNSSCYTHTSQSITASTSTSTSTVTSSSVTTVSSSEVHSTQKPLRCRLPVPGIVPATAAYMRQ